MRYTHILEAQALTERNTKRADFKAILNNPAINFGFECEIILAPAPALTGSDDGELSWAYIKRVYEIPSGSLKAIRSHFIRWWMSEREDAPEFTEQGINAYLEAEFDIVEEFAQRFGLDFREGAGAPSETETYDRIAKELRTLTGAPVMVLDTYHKNAKDPAMWYVESDPSVHSDDGKSAEVVSKVYKLRVGLDALEAFFTWMQQNGHHTNGTTGLHINLSIDGYTRRDYDAFKMMLFLDENHIAQQFDRLDNKYAKPLRDRMAVIARLSDDPGTMTKHTREMDDFIDIVSVWANHVFTMTMTKDSTFYLRNNGVAEFRMMGNTGYETQFAEIRRRVINFAHVMMIGAEPEYLKEDYIRKIFALFAGKFDNKDPAAKQGRMTGIMDALPSWRDIFRTNHKLAAMARQGDAQVFVDAVDAATEPAEPKRLRLNALQQQQLDNWMARNGLDYSSLGESATAGATGAASVATVVGGLGGGFDPSGDWGVYQSARKKKTKVAVIRR